MGPLFLALAGLAWSVGPVDTHLGYRVRHTSWVEALASPPGVLLDHDPALGEAQNGYFEAPVELDPALYQIVDVSVSAMDTWYVRALVDFDPESRELGRLAGRLGWKKARLYLETGLTSGRIQPSSLAIERIAVPPPDFQIRYRVLAVATEVVPGLRVGVGIARWTQPTIQQWYASNAVYDELVDEFRPQFAAVDTATQFQILGFFGEIRNVDALFADDPQDGTVLLYGDIGRLRAGLGLEMTSLFGVTRVSPDYGRYDELVDLSGQRPDLRTVFGLGTMVSFRGGGALVWRPGDTLRVGLDLGGELRSHMLIAVNPGTDQKSARVDGTLLLSYDGLLPMALFYGPYAGVTVAF